MLFYFIKINSIWRVVYYLFTIKYTNILVTAFKSVMQIKKDTIGSRLPHGVRTRDLSVCILSWKLWVAYSLIYFFIIINFNQLCILFRFYRFITFVFTFLA
jgi:hypothetical protein